MLWSSAVTSTVTDAQGHTPQGNILWIQALRDGNNLISISIADRIAINVHYCYSHLGHNNDICGCIQGRRGREKWNRQELQSSTYHVRNLNNIQYYSCFNKLYRKLMFFEYCNPNLQYVLNLYRICVRKNKQTKPNFANWVKI